MITINLSDISKQISDHLTTQKAMATVEGSCSYRGLDNTKCAVGCLISDAHYNHCFELKTIYRDSVFKAVLLSITGISDITPTQMEQAEPLRNVLSEWQRYHDDRLPDHSYSIWLDAPEEFACSSPDQFHQIMINSGLLVEDVIIQ